MPIPGFETLLLMGLPLLAVPILIHLINLMRHRRIEWAAMEFLLDSQRKNSRWVILKQLLLLLLRIAAIAGVVFMLAQLELQNQLGELLGTQKVHHVVLLDDSLSMSDESSDPPMFQQAKAMIAGLADDAAKHSTRPIFTLYPFSRAQLGKAPVMVERMMGQDKFKTDLEDTLAALEPSALRAQATETLEQARLRLQAPQGERRIYYIVSDFRANDWEEPGDLSKTLAELVESGADVKFIDCAGESRPNLAVAEVEPLGGTRAKDVEFLVNVSVKNYSDLPARNVSVAVEIGGSQRRDDRVIFDYIGPKSTESKRKKVRLATSGDHSITAKIDKPDAVAADNARHCVIRISDNVPVLIIDADTEARDAHFLSWSLWPEGPAVTGIAPRIEMPSFLGDNDLEAFRAVYLVNVDHLEPAWIEKLEEYVRSGGGLGIFLGKLSTRRLMHDQLYKDGEGLLPVPIAGAVDLFLDQIDDVPDIVVRDKDHPVVTRFTGPFASLINQVKVRRYFEVDQDWLPPEGSRMRILAELRNGAPYIVEQPFGKGRVVAFMGTAAPTWNDWGLNRSGPIIIQELQNHLTLSHAGTVAQTVSTKIEASLEAARYDENASFSRPGESLSSGSAALLKLPQEGEVRTVELADTHEPGVYGLELTRVGGGTSRPEVRMYAFNVDTAESDLTKLNEDQLRASLPELEFDYQRAAAFDFGSEMEGTNLTDLILYLVVAVLILEQFLSYLFSYHTPAKAKESTT